MKLIALSAVALGALLFIGCGRNNPSLQTVENVDLQKYAGKWYEIASFPQRFQRGCTGTTATYTATNDGYVVVENRCNRGSLDGRESYIKGKAFPVANSGNSKLKVQFFWPFRGDYQIIALADDYRYAMVGAPGRNSLWILSRTPQLPENEIQMLINKAKAQGFDTSRLQRTKQTKS